MNRAKNPFCLDPKETSCPRLAKLGMKWNPSTGTLENIFEKDTKIDIPNKLPDELVEEINNVKGTPPEKEDEVDINKSISTTHLPEAIVKGSKRIADQIAPVYLDEVPTDVSHIAVGIENPEKFLVENPEWGGVYNNPKFGMNVLKNDTTQELHFNFRGFTSENENETRNVYNILKGKDKTVQTSADFVQTEIIIEHFMERFPDYKVQFNGHSYGGYRAKYLASLYDTESVLLNSHHMPWSKFPKGGLHTTYTIVTDFLDLKHLFGSLARNERHFYLPQNKNIMGGLMDGHYLHQFFGEMRKSKFLQRYNEHIGVLGTIMIGFGLGESINEMVHHKDPTNTLAITGSGFTPGGLIVDPDYKYNDDDPPKFGIDYGIYKALQPFKSTILHHTPWGRERLREDSAINGIPITQNHPLADDPSVQPAQEPQPEKPRPVDSKSHPTPFFMRKSFWTGG